MDVFCLTSGIFYNDIFGQIIQLIYFNMYNQTFSSLLLPAKCNYANDVFDHYTVYTYNKTLKCTPWILYSFSVS